jgi:NAD(P)-dependent dehydrogenase (short-subunit alcohol dehydrogenase family)
MARLDGKTALVTGAATGIGRATARLLAQHGARVVLFGLDEDELEAAAAEAGGRAVHGDVTQLADIAKAVVACDERLDIVVNAAGLIIPDSPAMISDEVWGRTLDVNLTGTMRVCRAALPLLRQRGGAIANIASVAAFNASPDSASYAASKSAVVAYTRSLAYAHGADGIRANAVAPGWVRTPMCAYEMRLPAAKNGTPPDA